MGVEDSLVNFEGLTPQMFEALAEDGVKTLEDFATCADWELAGGWTTEGGERIKDDGVLEKFECRLEEAQNMVMTARVMLGWVDPADLVAPMKMTNRGRRGLIEAFGALRWHAVATQQRTRTLNASASSRGGQPKAGLIRFVVGPDDRFIRISWENCPDVVCM